MKGYKKVDEYILSVQEGREILMVLRELINSTELKETVKWGIPVYTINDKNVVGMAAFKSYVGLWFYNGSFLKDDAGVLINASEGITKALRQWRFTSADEINDTLLLNYLQEAIENQKQGKELKPERNKPIIIPDQLQIEFAEDKELEICFNRFTPGKQREFVNYISEAKTLETRKVRVEKVIPLILENIGLNDKYRK